MYKVIVRKRAQDEASTAYLYYEEQQEGLGDRFIKALWEKYRELSKNPELYSYISNTSKTKLRDVKIKNFPYLLVYKIKGNIVTIYMVHNTHKKPKY